MVHRGADEIEDMISEIVKKNPRISTTGIVNRLKSDCGIKLGAEAVLKFTNRMIQFGELRADRSSTGAVVYFYQQGA
jgi:hypothetical protein